LSLLNASFFAPLGARVAPTFAHQDFFIPKEKLRTALNNTETFKAKVYWLEEHFRITLKRHP
jgi:hypothetical protein